MCFRRQSLFTIYVFHIMYVRNGKGARVNYICFLIEMAMEAKDRAHTVAEVLNFECVRAAMGEYGSCENFGASIFSENFIIKLKGQIAK